MGREKIRLEGENADLWQRLQQAKENEELARRKAQDAAAAQQKAQEGLNRVRFEASDKWAAMETTNHSLMAQVANLQEMVGKIPTLVVGSNSRALSHGSPTLSRATRHEDLGAVE